MYKALIIDDEEPARRAIKALGAWEEYNISSLLEAENGKQGLEMLQVYQPELVFVDMKMPLLGGKEFLERARQIAPSAKYIVISGFNDFHFAKSAIQSGALDYLLKPIRKKELNQIVQMATEQLKVEKTQQKLELSNVILKNISLPLVKEKIFSAIIDQNGRFHQIRELAELLDAEKDSLFHIIIIKVLNISDVCKDRFAGDWHAFYFAFTNALNELLAILGKAFSFKSSKDDQEIVVVLSSSPLSELDQISAGIEAALYRLKEIFNVESIAAIGTHSESLEHLDTSYQTAQKTLLHVNMLKTRYVYEQEVISDQKRISIMEQRDLLFHALESRSFLYATNIIRDFFASIEQSEFFSIEHMLKTKAELRILLEQINKHFAATSEQLSEALMNYDRLFHNQIINYRAYQAVTINYFEHFFRKSFESNRPKDRIQVDLIKEYIELNYYEDISIAYFTEKYYVSKEHLLRLFKQKYGFGIYEYTLTIRMEKAKELLADPTLKIQTVSEKIGYHDTNYFSKAFKKHVGMSPQEYRLSLL